MAGILTRWRQLGRRYLWPHLLLSMVAASTGLCALVTSAETSVPQQPAAHNPDQRYYSDFVSYGHLSMPTPGASFRINSWQQHITYAGMIRQLSFSFAPQILSLAQSHSLIHVSHLALPGGFYHLLIDNTPPSTAWVATTSSSVALIFQINLWLSQIQGIRAGPFFSNFPS